MIQIKCELQTTAPEGEIELDIMFTQTLSAKNVSQWK